MTTTTLRRFAARLLCKGLLAAAITTPLTATPTTYAAEPPAATRLTAKQLSDVGIRGAVWVLNGTVANHKAHGSGWILDREAGLIVTNEHVIHNSDTVDVFFPVFENGKVNRDFHHYLKGVKPTRAIVLDREFGRDLALLKVESIPASCKALTIAKNSAEEGDEVRTVGGLPKGNEALWGTVRGEVRLVAKRGNAQGWVGQMLVTDMPSNPGNSGGAILNDRGEVVGVVESGYTGDFALNVTAHVDLSELKAYLAVARPLANPADARAFATRGQRRLKEGRLDGAAADFSAALKLDRKAEDALIGRGRVFLAKNDPATAIGDLDDALKLDDSSVEAHVLRGKAHAKLGKVDAAVGDMTKAIRINPSASQGYNERGIIHYDFAKNYKAAAEDFGRAIEAERTDAVLWSNRALALKELGKFEDAAADLNEAIRLRPNDVNYRNRLGLMQLWNVRNYDAAFKTLIEACKIDPKNPVLTANAADVLLEAKDYEKANAAFTDAFQLNRERSTLNVPYTAYRRGLARKGMNDTAGAIEDFSLAIRLNPNHAQALLERGQLLKGTGKEEAGQADLDKAAGLGAKVAATKPAAKTTTSLKPNRTGEEVLGRWMFDGAINGVPTYEVTTFGADGTVSTVVRVRGRDGVLREIQDTGTYTTNGQLIHFSMKALGRFDRRFDRKGDVMAIGMPDGTGMLDYSLTK